MQARFAQALQRVQPNADAGDPQPVQVNDIPHSEKLPLPFQGRSTGHLQHIQGIQHG